MHRIKQIHTQSMTVLQFTIHTVNTTQRERERGEGQTER